MSDEVKGTVVNAASGGPIKMKTPSKLRFAGTKLPEAAEPIVREVIAEYLSLRSEPVLSSHMYLYVAAAQSLGKDLAVAPLADRIQSLRQAIEKTGLLTLEPYSVVAMPD